MRRKGFGLLAGLVIAGFLALGALWAADRTRAWEVPRLVPGGFTVLRGLAGGGNLNRGVRLVAVHLGCPHCLEVLRRLQSAPGRGDGGDDLVVLLVDHDRRPPPAALEALGERRVWWDHRGVWRHRWGHRIYGEVLRFDRNGRYLGTTPATPPDPVEAPSPGPRQERGGDSE
jgi:hypothetical protein